MFIPQTRKSSNSGFLRAGVPKIDWTHPLARGLLAAYAFGNAGAFDLTGYNPVGSLVSSPSFALSPHGPALNFGSTGYVTVPAVPTLAPPYISVNTWLTPLSVTNAYNTIIQHGNGTALYEYYIKSTGKMAVYLGDSLGHNVFYDPGTISVNMNVENHLAFTWDSVTLIGYINGLQDSSSNPATDFTLDPTTFTLGIGNDLFTASRQFDAKFRLMFIHGRPLTAQEIQSLYYNPHQFLIFPDDIVSSTFGRAASTPTTLLPPSASWNWKGNVAILQFAVAAPQKDWVWNGQAPTLNLSITAAQKAWVWAANVPALKFGLTTVQKAWNWFGRAAIMTGGNIPGQVKHAYNVMRQVMWGVVRGVDRGEMR